MEVNLPDVHRSLKGRKEMRNDSFEGFTAVELTVPFFRGLDFVPMQKLNAGF
jgi:hypothetical protein